MSILPQTQSPTDFISWFFGPAFKARLDADRSAREAEAESAPSFDFGYRPSARDDAFWAGYTLGLDREEADPPAHFTAGEARHFRAGWAAGRREWDRRLDEMCGSAEYADFSGRITDRDMYPHGGVS